MTFWSYKDNISDIYLRIAENLHIQSFFVKERAYRGNCEPTYAEDIVRQTNRAKHQKELVKVDLLRFLYYDKFAPTAD